MARNIPVLYVDEQALCQQAMASFANTRFDLHCFDSVDAAQSTLVASRFEVAVVDLRATLTDGKSFIEHVIDTVPRIRCIAVVERPDIASVQIAMKLGCKGYLAKPVSAESILKSVNDVAQSSGLLTLTETELQKRLSRLLRAQRLRQELTLTEMANSIGLSKAQLSQIELGKSWPSFPTLKRITDALDQPFSELFKAIEQA